jgi:hypothetical protein
MFYHQAIPLSPEVKEFTRQASLSQIANPLGKIQLVCYPRW